MAKGKSSAARESKPGKSPEVKVSTEEQGSADANRKEMSFSREQLLSSFDLERSRYEAVSRRINMLQSAQFEISSAMEAIDEIEKSGKGNKIIVPLGGGVMVEAGLDNNKKVMFSYGGGAVTQKKIPEVRQELERRLELLKKEAQQAFGERDKINSGLSNLRNIIMLAEKNAKPQAAGKGQRNV